MSEALRVGLSDGRYVRPCTIERAGRKLAISAHYGLREELKCMRGAEWDKESRRWLVTDCRRNWIQLESLQVDEQGRYRVPKEHVRYYAPAAGLPEPRRPQVRAHQRAMFQHAARTRCDEWAAEQGVGKSLAAMELMEWAATQGFTNWWWCAPLKVVQAIELELEKWKCTVKPRLVHYDVLWQALEARFVCRSCGAEEPEHRTHKKHRTEEEDDAAAEFPTCRLCGTSTERHESLWRRLPDAPAPHGVVFDESSRLKNGGSRRAHAAQHLADAIRTEHDGFVILMSGTPAPRDPTDWHSQIEIAVPGWLRESTKAHLTRRLAIVEQGEAADGRPFPDIVGWKKEEVEKLYRRLKPVVEVHLAKDCLELPELTKEVIRLPVSDDVGRAARLIAQSSANAIGALNRLRQLSDGFQYGGVSACSDCHGEGSLDLIECAACGGAGFVDHANGAQRCPTPKDDRLRYDLGLNGETGRVVIYASYHASVDRVVDVCRDEGWAVLRCDGRGWAWQIGGGRETYWNEKELLREMDANERTSKIELLAFIAHPGSGGLGLNLTAARENIFYSNDFNAESRWQAEKRSHRLGQTRDVRIKDYCHLPTDELVLNNLYKKKALQSVTLGEVLDCLP